MFLNQGVIKAKFGLEPIHASTCRGKLGAVSYPIHDRGFICKTGRERESINQKDGKKTAILSSN
jgi:hypothetical protein